MYAGALGDAVRRPIRCEAIDPQAVLAATSGRRSRKHTRFRTRCSADSVICPTCPSVHVYHSVVLRQRRHWQQENVVIALSCQSFNFNKNCILELTFQKSCVIEAICLIPLRTLQLFISDEDKPADLAEAAADMEFLAQLFTDQIPSLRGLMLQYRQNGISSTQFWTISGKDSGHVRREMSIEAGLEIISELVCRPT